MYIIIPAYEPDKRLIQVVQDITIKLPKARIIVVNDGSGPGYNDYYDETAFIGATVLTPILSIKEKELLSKLPLLTFKKK